MHGKGRKLQQNLMARLEDIDDGIKLKWDRTELKGGVEANNANENVSALILNAYTISIFAKKYHMAKQLSFRKIMILYKSI